VISASSIASAEVVTKIVLYYFHERASALLPFGRQMTFRAESQVQRSLVQLLGCAIYLLWIPLRPPAANFEVVSPKYNLELHISANCNHNTHYSCSALCSKASNSAKAALRRRDRARRS
jgi:hypothetical protein